jgi:hypothetical protein
MLRIIENDLYDIADRLKEIDGGYFLCRNERLGRYEVHSAKNINGTLCLVSPYKHLDSRLVDLVLYTKRENAKRVFEDMERQNKRVEKEQINKAIQKAGSKFFG